MNSEVTLKLVRALSEGKITRTPMAKKLARPRPEPERPVVILRPWEDAELQALRQQEENPAPECSPGRKIHSWMFNGIAKQCRHCDKRQPVP